VKFFMVFVPEFGAGTDADDLKRIVIPNNGG